MYEKENKTKQNSNSNSFVTSLRRAPPKPSAIEPVPHLTVPVNDVVSAPAILILRRLLHLTAAVESEALRLPPIRRLLRRIPPLLPQKPPPLLLHPQTPREAVYGEDQEVHHCARTAAAHRRATPRRLPHLTPPAASSATVFGVGAVDGCRR